jgi:hypothetical protein
MAKNYLTRAGYDLLQIGVEFNRHRDAAERLVRDPWSQQRIRLIATELLARGMLSSEDVAALVS